MKKIRVLNTDGECFRHLSRFSLLYHSEKIKAGVFDGPQIRTLVHDQDFVRKMNDKERRVWYSFVAVMENVLGNKTANNYKTLSSELRGS